MLEASLYGELVIGVKGLTQQRQYVMEQWPEGKHIVFLDDDTSSIDFSISDVFKEQTLDYFFREAFREIESLFSKDCSWHDDIPGLYCWCILWEY